MTPIRTSSERAREQAEGVLNDTNAAVERIEAGMGGKVKNETLDDLDTEHARLQSVTHPGLTRLIQDLHAAISRRNWHDTEVAANRLRDTLK
jgi:hypothetical protein